MDTISRQAAIDKIKKRLFETALNNVGIKQNVDETLVDVAENRLEIWFNELPSIHSERKTGRWIHLSRHKWIRTHKCDQCGNILDFDGVNAGRGDANFCPNCGADMRGAQE